MMHIEACLRIRDKTITSFSGQGGIKGMASNREYLDFILEQLSGLANITYRAMMGEFILYYRGKICPLKFCRRHSVRRYPCFCVTR